jgi:hypothetical protein
MDAESAARCCVVPRPTVGAAGPRRRMDTEWNRWRGPGEGRAGRVKGNGWKTTWKETDVPTGLNSSRLPNTPDARDRCDGCATLTNGDGVRERGAWSVEHARRAAMKISQAYRLGLVLEWTAASPSPTLFGEQADSRRIGRNQRCRPGAQKHKTRRHGNANRLVGADKVGETEE